MFGPLECRVLSVVSDRCAACAAAAHAFGRGWDRGRRSVAGDGPPAECAVLARRGLSGGTSWACVAKEVSEISGGAPWFLDGHEQPRRFEWPRNAASCRRPARVREAIECLVTWAIGNYLLRSRPQAARPTFCTSRRCVFDDRATRIVDGPSFASYERCPGVSPTVIVRASRYPTLP